MRLPEYRTQYYNRIFYQEIDWCFAADFGFSRAFFKKKFQETDKGYDLSFILGHVRRVSIRKPYTDSFFSLLTKHLAKK